jgi:hypothetical protein
MADSITSSGVITPAASTYRLNADRLGNLIESIQAAGAKLRDDVARDVLDDTTFDEKVRAFASGVDFAQMWYTVMLVTFAETYIQDVLAFLAKHDASLNGGADQVASLADISEATSIEDLADLLRFRWAGNFIDRAGPAKWISKLERQGVRSLEKKVAVTLEELWGVRHVVVHRAGAATKDFVKRHPMFGATDGTLLTIAPAKIYEYLDALSELITAIDQYVVRRLGLKVGDARLVAA